MSLDLDPIVVRVSADVSQFRSQMAAAGGDMDAFAAKAEAGDKATGGLGASLADTAGGVKTYGKNIQEAYGLTDQLTASQARVIRGLEETLVAQRLSGAELAAYTALRRAGTSADTEAGQVIAQLAAAHYNLSPAMHGAGEAARVAAHEVEGLGEAAVFTREAIHTIHPILGVAGAEIAGLGSFASAARVGIVGLGVAITGAFVVGLENAGDRVRLLKQSLNATFGDHEAEHVFENLEDKAKGLGVSIEALVPASISAANAIKQINLGQQFDVRAELAKKGFSFVDSNAGNAALQAQADRKAEATQISQLIGLYQALGDGIVRAGDEARKMLAGAAKPDQAAAAQAVADMTKMFLASGQRAEEASKSATEFFAAVAKGGLTTEEFAKLPPLVQQELAEAFGVTGPDAIAKMTFALSKVPQGFNAVMTLLRELHPAVEELQVKPTIGQSWDQLTASISHVMETLGGGTNIVSKFFGFLATSISAAENGYMHLGELIANFNNYGKGGSTGLGVNAAELEMTAGAIGMVTDKTGQLVRAQTAAKDSAAGLGEELTAVSRGAAQNDNDADFASKLAAQMAGGKGQITQYSDAVKGAAESEQKAQQNAAGVGDALKTLDPALDTTTTALGTGKTAFESYGQAASSAMGTVQNAATAAATAVSNAVQNIVQSTQAGIARMNAAASAPAGPAAGGGAGNGDGVSANVGDNALGGIYAITGGGGTDSIALRGNVTPGEVVAVIPPGKATASLLDQLQGVISNSPIAVSGASSSPTTLTSIAAPSSYAQSSAMSTGANADGSYPALLPGGHVAVAPPATGSSSYPSSSSGASAPATAAAHSSGSSPYTRVTINGVDYWMTADQLAEWNAQQNPAPIMYNGIQYVRTRWGGFLPLSTVNISGASPGGVIKSQDLFSNFNKAGDIFNSKLGDFNPNAGNSSAGKSPTAGGTGAGGSRMAAANAAKNETTAAQQRLNEAAGLSAGGQAMGRAGMHDMGPLYDSHGRPLPQPGGPDDFHQVPVDSLLAALLRGTGIDGLPAFDASAGGAESLPGAEFAADQALVDSLFDIVGAADAAGGLLNAISGGADQVTSSGSGFDDYGYTTSSSDSFGYDPSLDYSGPSSQEYYDSSAQLADYYDQAAAPYDSGDTYYDSSVDAGTFAEGGRFTVPRAGAAGSDRVRVHMRVTPGEEVQVRPLTGDDRGGGGGDELDRLRRQIGDGGARLRAEALHFHIYGAGQGGALPNGLSRMALAREMRRAIALV